MNERIAQLSAENPQLHKYTNVMHENVKGLNDLIQEILDSGNRGGGIRPRPYP